MSVLATSFLGIMSGLYEAAGVVRKAAPGLAWAAPKLADAVFQLKGYPLGTTALSKLANPHN